MLPLEIALALLDLFHGLFRGLFQHDEPRLGLGQGLRWVAACSRLCVC
jgi:hypothetical protein